MDFPDSFRRMVRLALRLAPEDGTPQIDRLARYRATVVAASSDGKTVDLQPEDARVERAQGIPVRTGVPGLVAVVRPGSVVLMGWDAGDPQRPFAEPAWEPGASVVKLTLKADTIYLGDETGSQFVALAGKVKAELDSIAMAWSGHTHPVAGVQLGTGSVTSGPAATYSASAVAAAQVKAK